MDNGRKKRMPSQLCELKREISKHKSGQIVFLFIKVHRASTSRAVQCNSCTNKINKVNKSFFLPFRQLTR